MAYILFAAKFLFYLDDNAENLSSDFANKVNQYVHLFFHVKILYLLLIFVMFILLHIYIIFFNLYVTILQ